MAESKLAPYRDAVAASLAAGDTYIAIADQFGVSEASTRRFVRKEGLTKPAPSLDIQDAGGPVDETEKLKQQLSVARRAAKYIRTADVQAELMLDELRNMVIPATPAFDAPEHAEGDGHPHTHVLLLSDLHIGEVVDPEAMDGLNEYNWEIAQERMRKVLASIRSYQNARPYPIEELVVLLLGDNQSGRNHEELAETNEFSDAEQCWYTGDLIGKFIEQLVEDYPSIRVAGIVGNHPRVSKKPASKRKQNNFDWLGYKHVELYLQNYPTVTCHFPRSGKAVIDIAGKKGLLFHGDGIKSNMPGVPWGGVSRRTNELRKEYAAQGTALSYFFCGHFHDANVTNSGTLFMNGSLKGLDEYSLENFGSGGKPTQLLLTFDNTKERLTDVSFITPA